MVVAIHAHCWSNVVTLSLVVFAEKGFLFEYGRIFTAVIVTASSNTFERTIVAVVA